MRPKIVLTAVAFALALAPAAEARTIKWSNHTWSVRPAGTGYPGPNRWSDSTANVALDGTTLVLAVTKDSAGRWTSSEIENVRHLGYGTYKWVVASDLSRIDAHDVLG